MAAIYAQYLHIIVTKGLTQIQCNNVAHDVVAIYWVQDSLKKNSGLCMSHLEECTKANPPRMCFSTIFPVQNFFQSIKFIIQKEAAMEGLKIEERRETTTEEKNILSQLMKKHEHPLLETTKQRILFTGITENDLKQLLLEDSKSTRVPSESIKSPKKEFLESPPTSTTSTTKKLESSSSEKSKDNEDEKPKKKRKKSDKKKTAVATQLTEALDGGKGKPFGQITGFAAFKHTGNNLTIPTPSNGFFVVHISAKGNCKIVIPKGTAAALFGRNKFIEVHGPYKGVRDPATPRKKKKESEVVVHKKTDGGQNKRKLEKALQIEENPSGIGKDTSEMLSFFEDGEPKNIETSERTNFDGVKEKQHVPSDDANKDQGQIEHQPSIHVNPTNFIENHEEMDASKKYVDEKPKNGQNFNQSKLVAANSTNFSPTDGKKVSSLDQMMIESASTPKVTIKTESPVKHVDNATLLRALDKKVDSPRKTKSDVSGTIDLTRISPVVKAAARTSTLSKPQSDKPTLGQNSNPISNAQETKTPEKMKQTQLPFSTTKKPENKENEQEAAEEKERATKQKREEKKESEDYNSISEMPRHHLYQYEAEVSGEDDDKDEEEDPLDDDEEGFVVTSSEIEVDETTSHLEELDKKAEEKEKERQKKKGKVRQVKVGKKKKKEKDGS